MTDNPNKKQIYDRESYAFWKSQSRCVACHKQDAFTLAGRVRCAECTVKSREAKIAHRERNRDRLLEKSRNWYSRMKAERRCTNCGRPVEGKYSTCAGCRAWQRAVYAERAAKRKVPKSIAADCGICGVCNKRPAAEGKRTCPECYERNMKNLEKANAAIERDKHPWRRMTHAEAERRAAG